MSTRDELFAVLERAIVGKTSIVGAREATQAVINAGWRPPMRVASTVEDLEALPDGTIFKGDAYGGVWEKHDGTYWWGSDGFGAEETLKCADEYEMGTLRVIWEPEEDQ